MATQCIAEPTSRKNLRQKARMIRVIEGAENEMFFDIVHFLEITLPQIDPSFNLRILPKSVMGECHGLTFPDRDEIQIREDVYDRAIGGSGRDRMTMAHELGHLLQHEKQNISYARIEENREVPTYRDPEWQAEAFGGELLIPYHLMKGKSVWQIAEECKVSVDAAVCQSKK